MGEVVLRKTVYGAFLAACLFALSARAEVQPAAKCVYGEVPVAEPAPAADAAGKDKHRVTLLAVNPVEGTEVHADTVLELDIDYHVADFAADRFFFMPGFPTASLGLMSPGTMDDFHYFKSPSGKVHLCVPLKEVYEHQGVIWPLSFQITVFEQNGDGSNIVAQARKVTLNSVDIPAGALEAQNKAPPEDVQRALMMVFSHVEHQGALNKVCPARFPDVRTKFNGIYRAWESRNATNIRQIQELQYEIYSHFSNRSPAAAAMSFDVARNASVKHLGELKDPQLREQCDSAMESLGDETGDLPVQTPVNLDIVLDYLASKKKPEAGK